MKTSTLTLATGAKSAPDAGFTLTETLMVIFIIGLVSGLVVMNLPDARGGAQDDARALAARLTLAAQESVTSGEALGLSVSPDGYRFVRYRAGAWREIGADGGAFAPRRWDAAVVARAVRDDDGAILTASDERTTRRVRQRRLDTPPVSALPPILGDDVRARPPVIYDPSGVATPWRVRLEDGRGAFTVTIDPRGKTSVTREDEA